MKSIEEIIHEERQQFFTYSNSTECLRIRISRLVLLYYKRKPRSFYLWYSPRTGSEKRLYPR